MGGKPKDPAYWRKWRAAHPEYRARQKGIHAAWRAKNGRESRAKEYLNLRRQRQRHDGEHGVVLSRDPILEEAKRIVTEHVVRPDHGAVQYQPMYEDAVGEAVVALLERRCPVTAASSWVKSERLWLRLTCSLTFDIAD